MVGWLEAQPGDTWPDRWLASGAEGQGDWRQLVTGHEGGSGPERPRHGWAVSRLTSAGIGHLIVMAEGAGDPVRTGENIARLAAEVLPCLAGAGQQSTSSGRWLRIWERAVMNSW